MSKDQPRRANGQFASSKSKRKLGKKAPVSPGPNPALMASVQELRRSGAAGMHGDRRTKRLRTRADVRRQALEEQD